MVKPSTYGCAADVRSRSDFACFGLSRSGRLTIDCIERPRRGDPLSMQSYRAFASAVPPSAEACERAVMSRACKRLECVCRYLKARERDMKAA